MFQENVGFSKSLIMSDGAHFELISSYHASDSHEELQKRNLHSECVVLRCGTFCASVTVVRFIFLSMAQLLATSL
jgi:hypothetical protein